MLQKIFLVMWYQHGYFHMHIKINFVTWFRALYPGAYVLGEKS